MRRIVTGHDTYGHSVVLSDGAAPRSHDFVGWPGFASSVAWATTPEDAGTPAAEQDRTPALPSLIPGLGGTTLITLTVPPDSTMGNPSFDGATYGAESVQHHPGLAETFEADGMHRTPTVDYVFVLQGEVTLLLDDGAEAQLRTGDVVVQNGTRHGWSNRTSGPAVLGVVMVGTAAS